MEKKAMFYEIKGEKIHCFLCPHNCHIGENQFGLCGVRTNKDMELKTINYGEIASANQDPIEKKPLFHFKPGTLILSVGSFGCNFACGFCQNYSISQERPKSEFVEPKKLADTTANLDNNTGIAFTYNEPTIWYEYVYDVAKDLKENYEDIKVVLVTDGYITKEALEKLMPYVDAMNIDLKGFSEEYYKKICRGSLKPVMETIEYAAKHCHVEITTLLVSSLNDSLEEVEEISKFLAQINKNIPLHLSRYFPTYKMNLPATEINTILEAQKRAQEHLNYVFVGNVPNMDNSTYCPKCKELLIDRQNMMAQVYITDTECPTCGYEIEVVL
ncbi:AmmeMemoRadiSam system radical SAM enzyme [Anaeromicrobium sediminis]|uniref:AmmeMemoRadiSam system radical SAM enzyme n=1 Tax=Anaeromicrobium sediminis TaxID=1478221 RepID=A0A267MDQ7_9FIRM|nr:AmmeMemoRadiSam system radical SAM enzyme [Anaeromicrobium sediminis]PAB56923.1 AmmeMemoRadiSam system radical SAM enzyme [Anaeromicrobium sediminis]